MYYRNSDYEHNEYDFVGTCYNKILTFRLIESTYRTLFDGAQDRKFAMWSAINIRSAGQ